MLRPADLLDRFDIDLAVSSLPLDSRPEPVFVEEPMFVGFDDEPEETGPVWLEPARAMPEPISLIPVSRPRRVVLGPLVSLAVHLAPLLLLLSWPPTTAESDAPIPVQLVIEQPPPPAPPPKPAEKAPTGNIASEDLGGSPGTEQHSEEAPAPPEQKLAMAAPHPAPAPAPAAQRPHLTSGLAKPLPETEPVLPEPQSEPSPRLSLPAPKPVRKPPKAAQAAYNPNPAARYPGPDATRNEYLAYCESLIRRHSGLLSPAFLAGRRGATMLTLVVLGDGTIARIAVAQTSGYSDIDARIEQMVAAVGRFPPLPQWFQGSRMPLLYHFAFPPPG